MLPKMKWEKIINVEGTKSYYHRQMKVDVLKLLTKHVTM